MNIRNKCLQVLTTAQVGTMGILQLGFHNLVSFAMIDGKQSIKLHNTAMLVTKCQNHLHTKPHHRD